MANRSTQDPASLRGKILVNAICPFLPRPLPARQATGDARGLKHEGQSRHAKIEVGIVPSGVQPHVQGRLGGHHDNERRPCGPLVAFTQSLTNGGKAFTRYGNNAPGLGFAQDGAKVAAQSSR